MRGGENRSGGDNIRPYNKTITTRTFDIFTFLKRCNRLHYGIKDSINKR